LEADEMDEKWKIFIMTTIITVAIVLGIAAVVWVIMGLPQEEKCLIWQKVDEKIDQKNLQSSDYNLALNESNTLIPVYKDTYDWVKVGQSYNFYCSKGVFGEWICSASYECAEMHWG
jgi:hypothetical protein